MPSLKSLEFSLKMYFSLFSACDMLVYCLVLSCNSTSYLLSKMRQLAVGSIFIHCSFTYYQPKQPQTPMLPPLSFKFVVIFCCWCAV